MRASHTCIVLGAYKKYIFELDLSANLEVLKELTHYAIVLRHLVLHPFDSNHSKDFVRAGR